MLEVLARYGYDIASFYLRKYSIIPRNDSYVHRHESAWMLDDDDSWEIAIWTLFHDDVSISHRANRHTRGYEYIESCMVLIYSGVVLLITEMVSESFFRNCGPTPGIVDYAICE